MRARKQPLRTLPLPPLSFLPPWTDSTNEQDLKEIEDDNNWRGKYWYGMKGLKRAQPSAQIIRGERHRRFFLRIIRSSLADPKRCFDVSSKREERGPDSFFSPISHPNSPPLTVPFTRTRTIWVLSHSHDSGLHWGSRRTRFDLDFIWQFPFLVTPLQHTLYTEINGSRTCDSTVV